MLFYISSPKFLIAFVSSFILSYTLGYQHLVQASISSDYQFSSVHNTLVALEHTEELNLIPVVKQVVKVEPVKTIDLTDYSTFPDPKGDGSYESYKELFEFVSTATGVDLDLLARIAAMESSFLKDATPGGPNTAKGLFQFIDDTWTAVILKHGSKYGVSSNTSAFDPKANTIMAAMWLKDNIKLLENVVVNREVTETDVYLTHFLGRTGVQRFLKAEPAKVAASHMPKVAKRNKNIFYTRTNKARTYEEVYVAINTRFEHKAVEFNIN